MSKKTAGTFGVVVALLLTGFFAGRTSADQPPEKLAIRVQVSSSDHELVDGYFCLGDSLTVIVKPGTELYRLLARNRGRQITLTVDATERPELSTLIR